MTAQSHAELVPSLNATEQLQLTEQEAIIDGDTPGFIRVIRALAFIRDHRLYREYGSLDTYLAMRYKALAFKIMGMKITTRQRLDQLVDHVSVVENLSTRVLEPPAAERQSRELSRLSPELQLVAWLAAQKASGKTQPSSEWIKASVETVQQAVDTGGMVDTGNGKSTALVAAITQDAAERLSRQREHVNTSAQRRNGEGQDTKYQGQFAVLDANAETGEITVRFKLPDMAKQVAAGELCNFICWVRGGTVDGSDQS